MHKAISTRIALIGGRADGYSRDSVNTYISANKIVNSNFMSTISFEMSYSGYVTE